MATEIIRYVDPDATGAGDGTSWADAYTSLYWFEGWNDGDLVSQNIWFHVYCRSSSGTTDSTAISFNGWTTDIDHYVLFEAADTDRALKTGIDVSRYRVTRPVDIPNEQNFRFDGIQFDFDIQNDGETALYYAWTNHDSSLIEISNCYFKANFSGSQNNCRLLRVSGHFSYYGICKIWNCIFEGLENGNSHIAFLNPHDRFDEISMYNCVFSENDIAISDANAMTVKNCASFDNNDDFSGNSHIDYCASDDGDGTNSISPSGGDWTNEFIDHVNGDFTLLSTGNLSNAGIGPNLDSNVPSVDIDGTNRSGDTCSIGSDEFEYIEVILLLDSLLHSNSLDSVIIIVNYILSVNSSIYSTDIENISEFIIIVVLSLLNIEHSYSIDSIPLSFNPVSNLKASFSTNITNDSITISASVTVKRLKSIFKKI